jgi:hypothetical protein
MALGNVLCHLAGASAFTPATTGPDECGAGGVAHSRPRTLLRSGAGVGGLDPGFAKGFAPCQAPEAVHSPSLARDVM